MLQTTATVDDACDLKKKGHLIKQPPLASDKMRRARRPLLHPPHITQPSPEPLPRLQGDCRLEIPPSKRHGVG